MWNLLFLFYFKLNLFLVFLLFYATGVKKRNLFFVQIMILEHLHFCLANHACASHLLRGQPHLLECYYRNSLTGTCMCVHPASEWSVFFTLQCELFTNCNVSNNASLVSQRTGGGGGQSNVHRPGQGEGSPKNSQICADIPYGGPLQIKTEIFLFTRSPACLKFYSCLWFLWRNKKR